MQLNFSVQSVRLDSNTIVADVHSDGYDVQVRYDKEAVNEWLVNDGCKDINKFWSLSQINDTYPKLHLSNYISQSPHLLSSLRDQIRLKEIEAIIYEVEEVEIKGYVYSYACIGQQQADHLHSLITQYGDGRVETELLKVKS